jgi:hypothetical protein
MPVGCDRGGFVPEMTMEQYSKHKGVSRAAVQKAIRNGRIKVCRTEQRGKRVFSFIISEDADLAWTQNTDLKKKTVLTRRERRQEARASKRSGKPGKDHAPQPGSGDAGATDSAKPSGAYLKSRAMKEEFSARQIELDYRKAAGELVPVSAVKAAWANIAQNIQQNMLSIPSRLSALIAGEYKTQITLLIEKLDAGTTATKADLMKWLDAVSDDKIVSDLLMAEIKKILQCMSAGAAAPAGFAPAPAAAVPAALTKEV